MPLSLRITRVACSFPLALVLLLSMAHAGEGLYPLQDAPANEIEKEMGFKPTEAWYEKVQVCCAKVVTKGAKGGGSGAFVSDQGLLVTNRHVVLDALAQHSTTEKDLGKTGFYAPSNQDELPCDTMEILVLMKRSDLSEFAQKRLGAAPTHAAVAAFVRQCESELEQEQPELRTQVVVEHGGARVFAFQYQPLEARLVFVPDEAFGRFGGEEDNFRYPRHSLDVAFLRAYHEGKPIDLANYFRWAEKGVGENDAVFVAGHPGRSERYLPCVELTYLRDVEMPLQVASEGAIVKALEAYSARGDAERLRAAEPLERYSNVLKLHQGTLDFLKVGELMQKRMRQERLWRNDLEANDDAKAMAGTAFNDLAEICRDLTPLAPAAHYYKLPSSRLVGLARSLGSFARAVRGKAPESLSRAVFSFSQFLNKVLDPAAPIHLDVETVVLAAWLESAQQALPKDDPFLKTAIKDETPAMAAERIMAGNQDLTDPQKVLTLLKKGAPGIDESALPLLVFMRELEAAVAVRNEAMDRAEALEGKRGESHDAIARALYATQGSALQPDACSTLRLGWGKVCGYKEGEKEIPWRTTFASLLERSQEMGGKLTFAVPERLAKAQGTLKMDTPLDFVSTLDGAPGCSGAPIFDRNLRLLGILFDGNRQEMPSQYAYILPEWNGRSIAVHSEAVLEALEHIYHADALVKELKADASAPPSLLVPPRRTPAPVPAGK